MSNQGCELCGVQFANVFEAVDHATQGARLPIFNPQVPLASGALGLGELLRGIYQEARSADTRKTVSDAYAILYISKMRPVSFHQVYQAFIRSEVESQEFDLDSFVYKIVSQEAMKDAGLV